MRRFSFLIYSEQQKTVDTVSDQLTASGAARVVTVVDDVRELLDAITAQALDGIYIDLDSRPGLALDAVEETERSGTILFTGGSHSDPELLVRAMRLGARDFFLEHNLIGIANTLKSGRLESAAGVGTAPVVAVIGAKGGVGATTIACELTVSMEEIGYSTCIVDLSRRIGDVAMYFDTRPPNGVGDIARRSGELDNEFIEAVASVHSSGVSIIAAANEIEDVAALSWAKLDRALKILRVDYDFIVLDVPWDFDEYSVRAIGMADEVLQVTSPDVLSLTHARIQRASMDRLGVPGEHVRTVVNRLAPTTTITLEQMSEHLEAPLAAAIPEDAATATRCADEGLTFSGVEGSEAVLKAIHGLRAAVAEWFQLEVPEEQVVVDEGLVARMRGWMRRN